MGSSNAVAIERTTAIFEKLRERIAAAMPGLAAELQAQVLARSPSPEEEYVSLMLGDGGAQADIPPLDGYQSADNEDGVTDRIRFQKSPGTFLEELNSNPENVMIGADRVSIGNAELLFEGSTYSYQDHASKKNPGGGVLKTVGPYFEAFEYGSADVSGWSEVVTPAGQGYPLRPDDDPKNRPMQMYKPINPRLMYNVPELQVIARQFLDGIMAETA